MKDNNNIESNNELQKKRGRPKKKQEQTLAADYNLSISGSEKTAVDIEQKRKRGRPKKIVTPEMLASGNIPKEKIPSRGAVNDSWRIFIVFCDYLSRQALFRYSGKNAAGRSRVRQFYYAAQNGNK